MNGAADIPALSDEELTAYLDGELPLEARREVNRVLSVSEDARERLEMLRRGERPFAEAFDVLLGQAPLDRLRAGIPVAPAAAPQAATASGGWAPMAAAAAVLVALVGGFLGGMVMPQGAIQTAGVEATTEPAATPAPRGWRQAVADYQSLFTGDSLTPYQGGDSGLELANATAGFDFEPLTADVDGLNFRRIQVLQFNQKPLVQLAYLSVDQQPVSFCVIASGNPNSEAAFETRNGLGIVHWVQGGFGYMLIGDLEEAQLGQIASALKSRLGA
ncbi:MAG: anti-sigma factor family protein [Minwuia sp.]|uniref:anti-sigma factor family protein n=1 Tax=Minwuia sp. TaxID=2493630 RepID=UPI003A8B14AA